jgi:hypothetical protein
MVMRAWNHHAPEAFPHGTGDRREGGVNDVRRQLDPNENFRPALGIAAILLVAYSIVAGPLTFIRATKRGRPLDPLVWTPAWSLVALALIVFVGFAGKGFRGRARRISIAEAMSGQARAPIRRFRGFFSSRTRALTVAATDGSSVLDVSLSDSSDHSGAVLRVDRDGLTLDGLTALPWETVLVAEDGFADLKGGITIVRTPDGSADVTNHTGRTLADVYVFVPKGDIHYFDTLGDGASVHAAAGKWITSSSSFTHYSSGAFPIHAFDDGMLAPGKSSAGQIWDAIAHAAGGGVDFWPDDRSVVMAEVAGGEKVSSDSGLSVDSDRMFLRVMGR